MQQSQLVNEIVKKVGGRQNGQVEGVHKEIEKTLGIVPGFLKAQPVEVLEPEWKMMRDFELSDRTALEPRVKELIGLAVASVLHCRYCSKFHSEGAAMNGATPEQVNESLLMAKATAGWSAYLNGVRYDVETFDREVEQIKQHVARQKAQ